MEKIPFEPLSVILKSLDFAATRHRSQFRKGEEKTPYINHPIQVANLLVNEADETDPVLLSAAILHDVVEDTVDTVEERDELIEEIQQVFGDEILVLTLEVTDDKTLLKEERKRLQIEHAAHISIRAKKLKTADKIMNIRDIVTCPPTGWTRARVIEYLEWSEKVNQGTRGVNQKLDKLFDEELKRARIMYRIGY
jgi:GTP diphosphokinase / guanosine-3',5'-bis(diphosphate) 3'-diphosphatase